MKANHIPMTEEQIAQAVRIATEIMGWTTTDEEISFTNDPAPVLHVDRYVKSEVRLYKGISYEMRPQPQEFSGSKDAYSYGGFKYAYRYERWNPFDKDWAGIVEHLSAQDFDVAMNWRGKSDVQCNLRQILYYEINGHAGWAGVSGYAQAPTPGLAVVQACIHYLSSLKVELDFQASRSK